MNNSTQSTQNTHNSFQYIIGALDTLSGCLPESDDTEYTSGYLDFSRDTVNGVEVVK